MLEPDDVFIPVQVLPARFSNDDDPSADLEENNVHRNGHYGAHKHLSQSSTVCSSSRLDVDTQQEVGKSPNAGIKVHTLSGVHITWEDEGGLFPQCFCSVYVGLEVEGNEKR